MAKGPPKVAKNKMKPLDKVKITFRIDPEDQRGVKTESLWGEKIGPGRFRILNSPFFLFGISANDVVEADETAQGFEFKKVASRGGHSAYRIFLQDGRKTTDPDFRDYWQPISLLGALFENADDHFIAVDIPPGKDVGRIYELMTNGEKNGVWAFEEVYYAGEKTST